MVSSTPKNLLFEAKPKLISFTKDAITPDLICALVVQMQYITIKNMLTGLPKVSWVDRRYC